MANDHTDSIADLTALTLQFREERDWKQFHNPKELAMSLVLEAAEVLELMQWRSGEALVRELEKDKTALADELADVMHSVLLLSHDMGIDLAEAYRAKMAKNREKYPVDKARGLALKYTELDRDRPSSAG